MKLFIATTSHVTSLVMNHAYSQKYPNILMFSKFTVNLGKCPTYNPNMYNKEKLLCQITKKYCTYYDADYVNSFAHNVQMVRCSSTAQDALGSFSNYAGVHFRVAF